jgi:hypothetical protein
MIKTGLFTNRRSNVQPKIERTKKGELIYVFADGSWKYYWEWIATAPKDQFNLIEQHNQQHESFQRDQGSTEAY